jgi:glutaminase
VTLTRASMQTVLEASVRRARQAADQGMVSRQIPELSVVARDRVAMSVATVEGEVFAVGDSDEPFSLQSITKLFALAALLQLDPHAWDKVGWDPTSSGYGSVAELERHSGRPRNPFVNSGALVVTDRLHALTQAAARRTAELIARCSGTATPRHSVAIDTRMAESEARADHRNAAIAHVLAEHGRLQTPIAELLKQYFSQCAITATTTYLARASLFLASRDADVLDAPSIRRVNAVMLTAGMYGAAGEIAYRVGLPAKSGIGGGIVAVMPGRGVVAVWSPPLDGQGSSCGGVAALEEFTRLSGWTVF